MNQVSALSTREVHDADGPAIAVMMGLDLDDPAGLDAFMPEVGQAFASLVMTSPPGKARALLITLMGQVGAAEFRESWVKMAAGDPVVRDFSAGLNLADVIQGSSDGRMLSRASLLHG